MVVCQPPELEIRDIGDLTTEQFRGIFRLTYSGDAYIVLRTKVQVRAIPCFMLAVNSLLPHTPHSCPHPSERRFSRGLSGELNPHRDGLYLLIFS